MEKPVLPSYRESKILIQTLFDPFSLSSVDMKWLEDRYDLEKTDSEHKLIRKTNPIPSPKSKVSKKEKNKSAICRRREREDKADGKFTLDEWERLKSDYDNQCLRCGTSEIQIVPDHIRPLYRSGSGLIQNIQPLCIKCNLWKGLKIIDYRPGFAFEVV